MSRRWAGRLLAAGCMSAVTAGCLAGCGSASADVSGMITPAQARQVAQQWLHANYRSQVDQERGSLQQLDLAASRLRAPSPDPTPDSQLRDDTIWLAHQSHYPISFLCYDKALTGMAGGQAGAGEIFRFTKASPSASWTVTHQVGLLTAGAPPSVVRDSAGYAQLVSPEDYAKLVASPATLERDWAAYLQAGNASDAREFAPGILTTDVILNRKSITETAASKREMVSETYEGTADAVDAYLLSDGGALVLVALKDNSHVVATGSPLDFSTDGKGVAGPAPGKYRDVTEVSLILAAFTDPPKGSGLKVTGVAAFQGPLSFTGTRA